MNPVTAAVAAFALLVIAVCAWATAPAEITTGPATLTTFGVATLALFVVVGIQEYLARRRLSRMMVGC